MFFLDYLLFTYIVTSKPKRISVAAGLVHMSISPSFLYTFYVHVDIFRLCIYIVYTYYHYSLFKNLECSRYVNNI
jgi:hypothetical protein